MTYCSSHWCHSCWIVVCCQWLRVWEFHLRETSASRWLWTSKQVRNTTGDWYSLKTMNVLSINKQAGIFCIYCQNLCF